MLGPQGELVMMLGRWDARAARWHKQLEEVTVAVKYRLTYSRDVLISKGYQISRITSLVKASSLIKVNVY